MHRYLYGFSWPNEKKKKNPVNQIPLDDFLKSNSPVIHHYSPDIHRYSPDIHRYSPDIHRYSPDIHRYSPLIYCYYLFTDHTL